MIRPSTCIRRLLGATAAVLLVLAQTGCESDAKTGGLAGAGIGALAGNAIGGDTEATLIGAAIGAGVGYVIGNEQDKQKAEEMNRQTRQQDYRHAEVGNLGNSRWQVISLAPKDVEPP